MLYSTSHPMTMSIGRRFHHADIWNAWNIENSDCLRAYMFVQAVVIRGHSKIFSAHTIVHWVTNQDHMRTRSNTSNTARATAICTSIEGRDSLEHFEHFARIGSTARFCVRSTVVSLYGLTPLTGLFSDEPPDSISKRRTSRQILYEQTSNRSFMPIAFASRFPFIYASVS